MVSNGLRCRWCELYTQCWISVVVFKRMKSVSLSSDIIYSLETIICIINRPANALNMTWWKKKMNIPNYTEPHTHTYIHPPVRHYHNNTTPTTTTEIYKYKIWKQKYCRAYYRKEYPISTRETLASTLM